MANPLYEELSAKNQNGLQQPTMQQFYDFVRQFQQSGGGNPQMMVQQLLNSGRMSREQFNQCCQMANLLTGRNTQF